MNKVFQGLQSLRRRVDPRLKSARSTLGKARRAANWPLVVATAETLLKADPGQATVQLHMAEALVALGRPSEAERAFRAALAARPGYEHGALRFGAFLVGVNRGEEAVEVLSLTLARSPWSRLLRGGLHDAGGRQMVRHSDAAFGSGVSHRAVLDGVEALSRWINDNAFATHDYDTFRRLRPIAPPASAREVCLDVLVDARDASPADVRRTLASLLDQGHIRWQAMVLTGPQNESHPVSSYGQTDSRIVFTADLPGPANSAMVVLAASTVLDPAALAWLAEAHRRLPHATVITDHDHYVTDWKADLVRTDPVLRGVSSVLDTARYGAAVVLLAQADGEKALRALHSVPNAAAHLPRIVASVPQGRTAVMHVDSYTDKVEVAADARIRVIIPTRDHWGILDTCLRTLKAKARDVSRVSFCILDNGSTDPKTLKYLEGLSDDSSVTLIRYDHAFNWSLLNNVGAADATDEIFVFANNDVEMLVEGWDDLLVLRLSDRRVGVVGARLYYENRTLQHVGIALGAGSGRPSHEGMGALSVDTGPMARWTSTRQAAAVTGAFMAVRREVFESVGGFDPRWAIAYNDIDFCMKVREAGYGVLFDGALELVHYESTTRGFNNTREKIDWDDDELRDLYARWGEDILRDPSRNPQWLGTERHVFESLRLLSEADVIDWLEASSHKAWSVRRKG